MKHFFNWNLKNEVSIKELVRHYIVRVASRVKYQVLYVRTTSILNGRSDLKFYDEIKVKYENLTKITLFINIFCCFI